MRFQPETLLSIVESNKYNKYSYIYHPVIHIFGSKTPSKNVTPPKKTPKNPFRLFLNLDVDILLGVSAVATAVYNAVIATISSLFVTAYPFLNQTTVGLCFLSIGAGMALGSVINGKILDFEYQRFKRKAAATRSGEKAMEVDVRQEEDFPLEKVYSTHSRLLPYLYLTSSFSLLQARLRIMPIYAIIMAAASAGNGWCIQRQVHIAAPLILQFISAFVKLFFLTRNC